MNVCACVSRSIRVFVCDCAKFILIQNFKVKSQISASVMVIGWRFKATEEGRE